MTVSSTSISQAYVVGSAAQYTKYDSGLGFQFELEQSASDTQKKSGGASLWATDYPVGTHTLPFSSALWDVDSKTVPETLEDKQKTLDIKSKKLADEFLKFSEMTPAEKIRARVLGEKDLTEEDLAALSPEERSVIEKEIADAIKRAFGVDEAAESTGAAEDA